MTLLIKTKSLAEKIAATAFLYSLGYTYDNRSMEYMLDESSALMEFYSEYPDVIFERGSSNDCINFGSIEYDNQDQTLNWSTQFKKIKEFVLKKNTMKLTNDYDAEVTDDGIKVGCQLITFDKFDELAKLVKNNRN